MRIRNTPLFNLGNNTQIDLEEVTSYLAIKAVASSSTVGSVAFELSGPISATRVENTAPFSLFGGEEDTLFGREFVEGSYTLSVTAYSQANTSGEAGEVMVMNFTVVDEPSNPNPDNSPEIESVLLINANTNASLGELTNGRQINLTSLGNPDFTANALVSDEVASVLFELTGPGVNITQTENVAPYALFADNNGDFNGMTFVPGSYQLSVTAYAERNTSGEQSETLVITFTATEAVNNEDESLLFLVNSTTDQDISQLSNGLQIDANVAQNINIRLETDVPNIGSVGFEISGN